jgi:hypothetical protein
MIVAVPVQMVAEIDGQITSQQSDLANCGPLAQIELRFISCYPSPSPNPNPI